jgi:acyl carrier protein
MDYEALKLQIKEMIIEVCEKEDMRPEDIDDNVELFSQASKLDLDSLDALEISMGLKRDYGIRLGDSKEFRRTITTINELAKFVQSEING